MEAVLLPTFSDKLCVGTESIQAYFIEFMKKEPHCELVSSRQIDKDDVMIFNGFYNFIVGSNIIKARLSFIISDQGKILAHHSSLMPEVQKSEAEAEAEAEASR